MAEARFGKYQILERIGCGGVGEVLRARIGNRQVAVKRMLPHLDDQRSRATFATEARYAAGLHHPNVVEILEVSAVDGVPYVAMELVDGGSLLELMATFGKISPGASAFIVREVCRALACVHESRDENGRPRRLVHRDVTPSNILLSRSGAVKLCDFGIAKALEDADDKTRTGWLRGKIDYLSPEQIAGDAADEQSDLFSAGCVLYRSLIGRSPFSAPTDVEIIERMRRAQVVPPSVENPAVPVALDHICLRALAKDKRDRFSTATEMAGALDVVVRDLNFSVSDLAAISQQCFRGERAELITATKTRTPAMKRWRRFAGLAALVVVAGSAILGLRYRRAHGGMSVPVAADAVNVSTTTPGMEPTVQPFAPDSPMLPKLEDKRPKPIRRKAPAQSDNRARPSVAPKKPTDFNPNPFKP